MSISKKYISEGLFDATLAEVKNKRRQLQLKVALK
jgi:hypothetical protein